MNLTVNEVILLDTFVMTIFAFVGYRLGYWRGRYKSSVYWHDKFEVIAKNYVALDNQVKEVFELVKNR